MEKLVLSPGEIVFFSGAPASRRHHPIRSQGIGFHEGAAAGTAALPPRKIHAPTLGLSIFSHDPLSQIPKRAVSVIACFLFLVFAAELVFSIRRQSQTIDESVHIFAGYQYWKHRDFGANPEHPPLAKLVAALLLLQLNLKPTGILPGPQWHR